MSLYESCHVSIYIWRSERDLFQKPPWDASLSAVFCLIWRWVMSPYLWVTSPYVWVMHIRIYMSVHTHTHIPWCKYIHLGCTHARIYTHTSARVYTTAYTLAHTAYTLAYAHAHSYARMHSCIRTGYMHTYVHGYTHRNMRKHTYIHNVTATARLHHTP